MDCIFCRIVKGEIPSHTVFEDKKFMAFLDIAPVREGHTLVIPKAHSQDIFDLPADELQHYLGVVQRVAAAVKKATGAAGINVTMNNGAAAGQAVMHAHIHIIPRVLGDGLRAWPQGKYAEGEAQKIGERISQFMR